MKNKKGSLVIEASIALTAFMFLILFFLSFARIYRAQSVMSHASYQTSQTLAVESFTREKVGESGTLQAVTKLLDFYNAISGQSAGTGLTDSYRSLGKVNNLEGIIKEVFINSIADSSEEADEKLKKLGVKNGLNGVSFEDSSISGSDITIHIKYTVLLQFSFFGKKEIELEKTAVCKAFAKISEDNIVPTSPSNEEQ